MMVRVNNQHILIVIYPKYTHLKDEKVCLRYPLVNQREQQRIKERILIRRRDDNKEK